MTRKLCTMFALLVLLAGCLGPANERGTDERDATDEQEPVDPLMDGAAMPVVHEAHDPWVDNATELLVFEGSVRASFPKDDVDCATLPPSHECYDSLPFEGPVIPFGTKTLKVDADATGARKNGAWRAFFESSAQRRAPATWGEKTTADKHVWTWDLTPQQWDAPWWSRTQARIGFLGVEDGVLDGTIAVNVIAVRDPAWLPAPQVDHFSLRALHRMPQEGVITLLDANGTADERDFLAADYRLEPLEDKVVAGTTSLVVGMTWQPFEECPDALACRLRLDGRWANATVSAWYDPVEEIGPTAFVAVFEIPGRFQADHDMMSTGHVRFNKFIVTSCLQPHPEIGCPRPPAMTDYHVLVEAWKGPVDLDAFKTRLGAD